MKVVRITIAIAGIVLAISIVLAIVLGTSIGRDTGTGPPQYPGQARPTIAAGALPAPTTTTPKKASELEQAVVTHITDGDTVHVRINGTDETVRLIGVDAPELEHPDIAAECFGVDASTFLGQLIGGKTVWLEPDVNKRDRYGRLLRYVWIEQGDGYVLANALLVRGGYAAAREYDQDRLYADRLAENELAAIREARGFWSACVDRNGSGAGVPGAPAGWDGHSDLDCGDFISRADVQAFYAASGGPERDPFNLDVDHNGLVCLTRPPTDPIGT